MYFNVRWILVNIKYSMYITVSKAWYMSVHVTVTCISVRSNRAQAPEKHRNSMWEEEEVDQAWRQMQFAFHRSPSLTLLAQARASKAWEFLTSTDLNTLDTIICKHGYNYCSVSDFNSQIRHTAHYRLIWLALKTSYVKCRPSKPSLCKQKCVHSAINFSTLAAS